jgi:hypothetical protein
MIERLTLMPYGTEYSYIDCGKNLPFQILEDTTNKIFHLKMRRDLLQSFSNGKYEYDNKEDAHRNIIELWDKYKNCKLSKEQSVAYLSILYIESLINQGGGIYSWGDANWSKVTFTGVYFYKNIQNNRYERNDISVSFDVYGTQDTLESLYEKFHIKVDPIEEQMKILESI